MDYTATEVELIREGRSKFLALAMSYFIGVFNDNFFKQAALVLAVVAGKSDLQGTATILFALPFILFSSYAGWFADRFPKKNVVIISKFIELIAMIIGAYGLITMSWGFIVGMIFIMGLQSIFFGPAINGSIPELYPESYVLRANAIVKFATTIAILFGIACAGVALDQQWFQTEIPFGILLVCSAVITLSVIGLVASFGIVKCKNSRADVKFPWRGPFDSLKDVISYSKIKDLSLALWCCGYFYFISSLVVLIINSYGLKILELSKTSTSMLSVALMVGVSTGAFFAVKITKRVYWTRVSPFAAFGMGFFLITGAISAYLPIEMQGSALAISMVFAGLSSGIFLIPTISFFQTFPEKDKKGKTIAASYFVNFVGILISGQLYMFFDSIFAANISMGIAGVFTLLLSFIIFKRDRIQKLLNDTHELGDGRA